MFGPQGFQPGRIERSRHSGTGRDTGLQESTPMTIPKVWPDDPLHILLMPFALVSHEPRAEVYWHVQRCWLSGHTWVASTERVGERLDPGQSLVVFLAGKDDEGFNRILAQGTYQHHLDRHYYPLQFALRFEHHPLYVGAHGRTDTMTMIKMDRIEAQLQGQPADALHGIVCSTGEFHGYPLTQQILDELFQGEASSHVYWQRCRRANR
jgi:hypothetical protein